MGKVTDLTITAFVDDIKRERVSFTTPVSVRKDGVFTTTLPKEAVTILESYGVKLDINRLGNPGYFENETLAGLEKELNKVLKDALTRELVEDKVDYDHEMWKNCEANFEGGKKEVIEHPEKYGLQKPADLSEMMVHKEPYIAPVPTPMVTDEQESDTRDADDLQLLGFIYDLLNEIEWKDNWAMSKDECLRRLNNYRPQKPVEWSDTDNTGWDEAFACVTRAEKAAKSEEELQNAVTAEKWLKEIKFKYCVHPVKQEWSNEDKAFLTVAIAICNRYSHKDIADWLKSLPERFNLQPKVEWSEEDEEMLDSIIRVVCGVGVQPNGLREKQIRFLKSLRPSWKPSEHQMTILKAVKDYVGSGSGYWGEALGSLIDDLEKLT